MEKEVRDTGPSFPPRVRPTIEAEIARAEKQIELHLAQKMSLKNVKKAIDMEWEYTTRMLGILEDHVQNLRQGQLPLEPSVAQGPSVEEA